MHLFRPLCRNLVFNKAIGNAKMRLSFDLGIFALHLVHSVKLCKQRCPKSGLLDSIGGLLTPGAFNFVSGVFKMRKRTSVAVAVLAVAVSAAIAIPVVR